MIKTTIAAMALMFATTGLLQASTGPAFDKTVVKSKQDTYQQDARDKKRVPGGSGCDDAGDYAEHPECRG